MIHVKIVVQDGLVQEVYSDTKDIYIDILDMDTCDPKQEEENELEYNNIREDYPYLVCD